MESNLNDNDFKCLYADDPIKYGPPAWLGISVLVFFILAIWGIYEAVAAPVVKVNVFVGKAPISVTQGKAHATWNQAVREIRRELGVRIITKKWRTIKQENHPSSGTKNLDLNTMLQFDVTDAQWKYSQDTAAVLLSAPAVTEQGFLYYAGVTSDYDCSNFAWRNTAATIYYGREGLVVLKHELGHLLGAEHTEGDYTSIMDSNVLSNLGWPMIYLDSSKREIRQCMRRV